MTTTYSEELTQFYQSADNGPYIVLWAGDGEVEQVYAPAHAMGKRFDYVEIFLRTHTGVVFDFRRAIGGDTIPGNEWFFFDELRTSLFVFLADMFFSAAEEESADLSQP